MDPITGERIFSTFVEVGDDEGEFNMATVLQGLDEPTPDGWEFNLATIATKEKVMAARDEPVPENWILLDSQSTCNIVKTKGLLKNIKSSRPATMYSQGGKSTITKKGMLGTLESYMYEEGIANILSLLLSEWIMQ